MKLYNLLVEYDLKENNFPSQLTEPKKYITIIKSQVYREVIIHQLMKLVNKIEMGEKWEVMTYYYLLYDDLNYLDENNIELILLYVLNVMTESTQNEQEMENYVNRRRFSIFGTYLITEEIKKEFFTLLCNIVNRHTIKDYIYYAAYDQLINSVDSDKKEKTKEFIIKTTSSYISEKFYKGYKNGDYLPF
jgi:hypothetical protein